MLALTYLRSRDSKGSKEFLGSVVEDVATGFFLFHFPFKGVVSLLFVLLSVLVSSSFCCYLMCNTIHDVNVEPEQCVI